MFKKILATLLALFAAAAFAAVDVNTATQADLETIKGIGPAISARILEERGKSKFKDWQDLIDRVKGVGAGNAAKFSTGGLTVSGSAFAGAAAPAAKPTKTDTKKAAPAATPAATTTTPAATAAAPAAKASDAKPASASDKKAADKAAKEEKKAAAAKEKADKKAAKEAQAAEKAASAAKK